MSSIISSSLHNLIGRLQIRIDTALADSMEAQRLSQPEELPSYLKGLGDHPKPAIRDHLKTGQR
jgi:hypothetical protein